MANKMYKKEIDYRLDCIEFENYKGYSGKQKFDLTTDRRYSDDYTTDKVEWNTKRTNKYKKVIGIWGKNAAGKSSIIEILNKFNDLFTGLNVTNAMAGPTAESTRANALFQKHINELHEDPAEVLKYNNFNNPKKPVVISMTFSTNTIVFKYTIKDYLVPNEKNSFDHDIYDSVKLIKNNNVTEIWNSKKFGMTINYFMNIAMNYEKTGRNVGSLSKVISGMTNKEVSSEDVRMVLNHIDDLKKVMNTLILFNQSNLPLNLQYRGREGYVEYSQRMISILQLNNHIAPEKIIEVVNTIIKSLDNNVARVNFSGTPGPVHMTSIENENGNKNFIEDISLGTALFLHIFLCTWQETITLDNKSLRLPKYLFIDEMGQNWHTRLTDKFINMVCDETFGKMILVFTTHDAFVGDSLPPDAKYVINNEGELLRVDTLLGDKGSSRADKKFSSDYLNRALDVYSTNPDLDGLEDAGELINDDDK